MPESDCKITRTLSWVVFNTIMVILISWDSSLSLIIALWLMRGNQGQWNCYECRAIRAPSTGSVPWSDRAQRALEITKAHGQPIAQPEIQHFAIAQLLVEEILEVLAGKCTDCLGDESVCDEYDDLSGMYLDHRVEMQVDTGDNVCNRLSIGWRSMPLPRYVPRLQVGILFSRLLLRKSFEHAYVSFVKSIDGLQWQCFVAEHDLRRLPGTQKRGDKDCIDS